MRFVFTKLFYVLLAVGFVLADLRGRRGQVHGTETGDLPGYTVIHAEVPEHELSRYPIDPRRIVLLGFSQGGIMAFELALREPQRFAGLVALSTWFPAELAATLERKPEHAGFPVLVLHGTADPVLPVERARESREALRPYGVAMTYRELQMGHTIDQEAMRILLRWLKEKALRREAVAAPT